MNLATDFTNSRLYETDAGMRAKMRRHGKKFVKQKAWKEAHKDRRESTLVVTHPNREMMAANEYFHGTATWRYEVGIWTCIRADECLNFLLNRPQGEAQLELTKRGFKHEWRHEKEKL